MNGPRPLGLFDAFGVELEYMIVGNDGLNVRPITDRVLHDVAGCFESEVELGDISWSNELALHVIELKTTDPAPKLNGLARTFQTHVERINQLLQPHGARLMPTAMHPWMNPDQELQLWPHDYNAVYDAFNRIFDCRGHGWANLQSVHLNLPFANDDEFGRLHTAIRVVLPLLPALAASSPLLGGKATGLLDNRLEVYRHNAAAIPSISAAVVPEAVFDQASYHATILQPMYRDIAPYDPDGTLQHEWLNARGAIARFDRNTIEIRVLDIQECPQADLAILQAIVAVLKALVAERWGSYAAQQQLLTPQLASALHHTIRAADQAVIDDPQYLSVLGETATRVTVQELWRRLIDQSGLDLSQSDGSLEPLRLILEQGPLARRILRHVGTDPPRPALARTYERLCECLRDGQLFRVN